MPGLKICVWAQTCLGTNVHVCAQTHLWFVPRHDCDHTIITCQVTNMSGHKRVWAQTCMGTNVSGHKRVCMGTFIWMIMYVWFACEWNSIHAVILTLWVIDAYDFQWRKGLLFLTPFEFWSQVREIRAWTSPTRNWHHWRGNKLCWCCSAVTEWVKC